MRLLLVDDSPHFVQAARGLLERQGLTVVGVAAHGSEALRQAQALRPDVTLVDIDLGGESGFELARRLHQEAGLAPGELILIPIHDPDDFAELIAAQPGRRVPLQGRPVGRRHPRPARRRTSTKLISTPIRRC